MEAEQILKRIGYDNNSITATEMWIAKEVYRLAMEDAAALRQPPVSGRSELLIALQNIEKICDNQNPTHEQIWRIAYEAINSH